MMKFLDFVVILLVYCTLVVLAKDGRKDSKDAERIKRNVNNGFPATRVYNGPNNLFNYAPGGGYGYSGNYGVNDPNDNVYEERSALFDQYGNLVGSNYNIRRPIGANYNLVNGNNNVNPNMVPIYPNFNGYKVPELLGGYDRNYNLINGNMRPNFDLNVGNTNSPGLIDGNYRNFGFAQDPNYNSLNGFNGNTGLRANLPRSNFPENSNLYQENLGGFNSYPGLIQENNYFSGIDPNSGLIARSGINGQNPANPDTGPSGLMDEKTVNLKNEGVGAGTKNETVTDKGAFLGEKVV